LQTRKRTPTELYFIYSV